MIRKGNKRKESSRYNLAVGLIIIAIIVITALDVFNILITGYPELLGKWFDVEVKTVTVSREDGFLSSGLSIIGMAISVWAILNITNVLDKKDVEDIKRALSQLKEENEAYAVEQHYNILLGLFERCSTDIAMKYLADKFREMKDIPYAKLSIVMQYYVRVYELSQEKNNTTLLSNASDEGIRYVSNLLEQADSQLSKAIDSFLHYCLAEFFFAKTYCDDGLDSYYYAVKAIEEYDMSFSLFNIKLPVYSSKKMDKYPSINFDSPSDLQSLAAYLCNTYGECFSKAARGCSKEKDIDWDKNYLKDLQQKAIFYCEYAVKWSETDNQTYLRNLGCALEAHYGEEGYTTDDIRNKISETYQRAMDISIIDKKVSYKVFYTWLSFEHRCADRIFDKHISKDKREIIHWLYCRERITNCKWSFDCEAALKYASLANITYPDNLVFLKLHAFALRDLCIKEIKCNGKIRVAVDYFDKLEYDWELLECFYPEKSDWDDYMNELENWHEALKYFLLNRATCAK